MRRYLLAVDSYVGALFFCLLLVYVPCVFLDSPGLGFGLVT